MRTPEGRIATLPAARAELPARHRRAGTRQPDPPALRRPGLADVGFLVALVSLAIGAPLGLIAGYYGGRIDDLVNALVQFVINIPSLFILIILSVLFTPSVLGLALIFGLFYWPGTTRQVRGLVLSLRNRDYVDAARVLGASDARILARHILPNVVSIVTVVAGFDVASAILGESALSFLGFGVPVPLSSWGNMLSGSQDTFRSAPWLVYPPGLMILADGAVRLPDRGRPARRLRPAPPLLTAWRSHERFARHIRKHLGEPGDRWLHDLPALAAALADRWQVVLGDAVRPLVQLRRASPPATTAPRPSSRSARPGETASSTARSSRSVVRRRRRLPPPRLRPRMPCDAAGAPPTRCRCSATSSPPVTTMPPPGSAPT